jgi:hypothetical protein
MLPDISGPKVLSPTLLFLLMSSGVVDYGTAFNALLIIVLLTLIYKFILRVTYKPADLIMPALLFTILKPGMYFTFPPGTPATDPVAMITHSVVFALAYSLLRVQFPQYY